MVLQKVQIKNGSTTVQLSKALKSNLQLNSPCAHGPLCPSRDGGRPCTGQAQVTRPPRRATGPLRREVAWATLAPPGHQLVEALGQELRKLQA